MGVWISFLPRGGKFAHQKNYPGFAGRGGGQAWNWLIHKVITKKKTRNMQAICGMINSAMSP